MRLTEDHPTRLKRLRMRSMRRGTKEMDIILSRYAETKLGVLTDAQLELYDAFLSENDQDLYQWVTGQVPPPDRYSDLVGDIARTSSCVT